jgi:hypothetical protein
MLGVEEFLENKRVDDILVALRRAWYGRNGVKIFNNWVLGMSIFTQKLTRQKKYILKYSVYYIPIGFDTLFRRSNR